MPQALSQALPKPLTSLSQGLGTADLPSGIRTQTSKAIDPWNNEETQDLWEPHQVVRQARSSHPLAQEPWEPHQMVRQARSSRPHQYSKEFHKIPKDLMGLQGILQDHRKLKEILRDLNEFQEIQRNSNRFQGIPKYSQESRNELKGC